MNYSKAFDLVCPGKHAAELAARGLVPAEAVAGHSWRDEICAVITQADLDDAGVTLTDVLAAIEHYTATLATVRPCPVKGLSWVTFIEPQPGFLIMAKGYRKGPAGP